MKIKKHKDKPELSGEHTQGDIWQIILFFLFIGIWITDSFFLKFSTFITAYIPLFVRIILSVITLSISGLLAKQGLRIVFKEERDKPGVIRKGVFNIVRHPIYLGSILLYLGLVFLTLSIASIAVWLMIIAFYYFISRYEEKILLNEFGDDYRQYMREVPMFIPFIKIQ
jgi:protein-S-isoprenylcysteine O-methyltransferase Ste14